jgi:Fur family zinc uptake transcriptional regulator
MAERSSFPASRHDHGACKVAALAMAADLCRRRGVRLTDAQRLVLELVWDSHRPIGAYGLLKAMIQKGRSAAPPTVYRALDFLRRQGLVHRIESRNAYVGCPWPGHDPAVELLICSQCGQAGEIGGGVIAKALSARAQRLGFAAGRQTIEVEGRCRECRRRKTHA